jgi:hypothetical protein
MALKAKGEKGEGKRRCTVSISSPQILIHGFTSCGQLRSKNIKWKIPEINNL